jgi:signal transduction histidine kinase
MNPGRIFAMVLSPSGRRSLVPYLILVGVLAVTAGAAFYAHDLITRQADLTFQNAADRVESEIEGRLDAYIAMLHGGAGLFAASSRVEFNEFKSYVERLELPQRYPGVQGIGFSRFIPDREIGHVSEVIRVHVPSFHYWPESAPSERHAIIFLEPENAENLHAIGFNMFSEPTRREAMLTARDKGAPAASGRVHLVQDDVNEEEGGAGFLIYEPVYRSGTIPPTVEARREELLGFVYSPFRARDLFRGMIGRDDERIVTYAVYDAAGGQQGLLYESGPPAAAPRFRAPRQLTVAGRPWTLVVESKPELEQRSFLPMLLIVTFGSALALLLFGVTRAQVRARESAERTSDDLRRSEEALRAANRSKDEFLAIVSHELRTPLNAIVGWGAMLRRGQVPHGSERHALEVIERNALAQARLVEDLLDISRAVAGRLRLELTDVSLAPTLRAAVDAVRPAATTSGVALALDLPDDLGVVRGDPARVQQIVQNLLANAIKFTKPGGRVRLEASRQGEDAAIRVTDNGMGIDPAFLPFIFEPFRQADTSTTRTHGGIGLGLAIVRHLVSLHGGTIDASSSGHGQGSTFTVRLRGGAVNATS